MKLIMKDKAVARPVILYLRNIPVLALPYYIFRSSTVAPPGYDARRGGGISRSAGRFVRNLGYYWAISDYMDAKAWVDFYDRGPRFYWNGEYQYRVRYLLGGRNHRVGLRESDTYGNQRRRWSVVGSTGTSSGGRPAPRPRPTFPATRTTGATRTSARRSTSR